MKRIVIMAVVLCCAGPALADTDAVIAKARAYLGTEDALNSIRSIHYFGTLEAEETVKDKDGKETTRPFKASIEIIFEKPYHQRFQMTSERGTQITALDNYDSWLRVQPAGTQDWRLNILGPAQTERFRANTWENLFFYRGLESTGGHVEDLGSTTIDGQACEKLAFVHAPGIVFYRYIDTTTGKLLLTETETGSRLREEGEMMVNGVRFLKKLVTVTKDAATGRENTSTITMDKIVINETFPDDLFVAPLLTPAKN